MLFEDLACRYCIFSKTPPKNLLVILSISLINTILRKDADSFWDFLFDTVLIFKLLETNEKLSTRIKLLESNSNDTIENLTLRVQENVEEETNAKVQGQSLIYIMLFTTIISNQ